MCREDRKENMCVCVCKTERERYYPLIDNINKNFMFQRCPN